MIELIYTLFLLSGFVKFFFLFVGTGLMVVDFTLLCAMLLVGIYVIHFLSNVSKNRFHIVEESRSAVFAVLAFYLWMIITLTYTRSPGYCYIKVIMFLTCAVALVFPFVYRGFKVGRFLRHLVYMGSGLIFIYTALLPNLYAAYQRSYENREFVVKYLDIGYLAGIIILVLAFASPKMNRVLKILLIGFNGSALIVTAARGPIVFLAIVLLIKFGISVAPFIRKKWKLNFKNIVVLLTGITLVGAGISYLLDKYAPLIERSLHRLLLLFDPYSASVAKRFSQIGFSLDSIFKDIWHFLFGTGIGSFGFIYDGMDERNYPHNVILEIGFETGIIGVILFVLVLLLVFKKIRHDLNLTLIFTYLMLNSLKSFSLVDSRIMFGMVGILLLAAREVMAPTPVTHPPPETLRKD